MMRSCSEVSRLASERMDRELTLRERLAFNMHVMVCRNCRRYARQIALVRQATGRLRQRGAQSGSAGLSDEARARIARKLSAAGHQVPPE